MLLLLIILFLKYYNKSEKDMPSIITVSNIPLIFSFRYAIA